tara:strand:- start:12419 stop:14548 length:2130 start_codon:yes stop_codon:yes gene_type:complete
MEVDNEDVTMFDHDLDAPGSPEFDDGLFEPNSEEQIERARRKAAADAYTQSEDAGLARLCQAHIERTEQEQGARARALKQSAHADNDANEDEEVSMDVQGLQTAGDMRVDEGVGPDTARRKDIDPTGWSSPSAGEDGGPNTEADTASAPIEKAEKGIGQELQVHDQAFEDTILRMEQGAAQSEQSNPQRPKSFRSWRQRHADQMQDEWEDELAWSEIEYQQRVDERHQGRRMKPHDSSARENEASRTTVSVGQTEPLQCSEGQSNTIDDDNTRDRTNSTEQSPASGGISAQPLRWRVPGRDRSQMKLNKERIYTEYLLTNEFIDDINVMLDYIRNWTEADARPIMQSFMDEPENESRMIMFYDQLTDSGKQWIVRILNPDVSSYHPRLYSGSWHLPLSQRPKRLDWGIAELGGPPPRCLKEGCATGCPRERTKEDNLRSLIKGRNIQRSERILQSLGAIDTTNNAALPTVPDEDRRKMPPPPLPPLKPTLLGVPKDIDEIKARIRELLALSTRGLAGETVEPPSLLARRVSKVLGSDPGSSLSTSKDRSDPPGKSLIPPSSPRPVKLKLTFNAAKQRELQAIRPPSPPPSPSPSPPPPITFQFMPTVTPDPEPTPPSYYIKVAKAKQPASSFFGKRPPLMNTQAKRLPPQQKRLVAPVPPEQDVMHIDNEPNQQSALVKTSRATTATKRPKKQKQHCQIASWQIDPNWH